VTGKRTPGGEWMRLRESKRNWRLTYIRLYNSIRLYLKRVFLRKSLMGDFKNFK
jgi:hypothetical protein